MRLSDCFKRFASALLLALYATFAHIAGASAEAQGTGTRDARPFEMIRSLQVLQEQIAQGNSHALRAQRSLLVKMDRDFFNMPADMWQEPRNARAAVVHLLSGGTRASCESCSRLNLHPPWTGDFLRPRWPMSRAGRKTCWGFLRISTPWICLRVSEAMWPW